MRAFNAWSFTVFKPFWNNIHRQTTCILVAGSYSNSSRFLNDPISCMRAPLFFSYCNFLFVYEQMTCAWWLHHLLVAATRRWWSHHAQVGGHKTGISFFSCSMTRRDFNGCIHVSGVAQFNGFNADIYRRWNYQMAAVKPEVVISHVLD